MLNSPTSRASRWPGRKRTSLPLAWLRALLCLQLLGGVAASAQELTPASAVSVGGEALAESGNYPWYDESQDAIRRIDVAGSQDADSANRDSTWTKQPATATPGGNLNLGWSGIGWTFHYLFIFLFIVLLGVIVYLVARAFLKDETRDDATTRRSVETSHDVDRVQALPVQLRKPSGDFLAEARRLYEAGQYSEAIIYLYSYQLVQLDRHHVIRLTKGKTNRQYLREARQRPVLRTALEPTMVAFEDAFFGHKTLTRERFEACWNHLNEFHAELNRLERAAA